MTNQVEVRDVVDIHQYYQNLIFTAFTGPNEDKIIDMLKVLVSLGVDFLYKDKLKQTPLFYAAKNGYDKLI